MKELFSNKFFQLALRIIIGGLFIYAAYDKILNPDAFARAVNNYKILPLPLVNIMAIILPYIEIITGLFLLGGIYRKGSSLIIIVLLVVFLIALISAYARGLDISCGCFSLETSGTKSDILFRIIEDLLMLAGAYIIFKFSNKNLNNEINNSPGGITNE